jgi:hypothetical protein
MAQRFRILNGDSLELLNKISHRWRERAGLAMNVFS